MKPILLILATISLAGHLLAETAAAATIPTTYVVDEKALKNHAPAGTTVTFGLYSDSSCATLVESDTVNIEDVLLRERVKPLKVKGDTNPSKSLVEMRHTFTADPDAGSDLYVAAAASVAEAIDTSTTLLGDCQAQQPSGGADAGGGSAGSIIPIASGLPVTLTTDITGASANVGLAGFGGSASVSLVGGLVDLTGGPGNEINYAFSMPRDGIITGLSGYFSTTTASALIGTTVTISTRLYCSATPDNIFAPVPGTSVTLAPALTGIITIGTIGNGLVSGLNIPVTAETRCMMVFAATATGASPVNVISGYASGGIVVE